MLQFCLDPHQVHCIAITKEVEFYTEPSRLSGPYTLQGKSLQVPLNWGKYSTTNIGQIATHLFILET